jgi:hypothetical protein
VCVIILVKSHLRAKKHLALYVKIILEGNKMSWRTIKSDTKTYKTKLTGTEAQWLKKLEDIKNRKHEVLQQGSAPYKGDLMDQGKVRDYWAVVKITG